MAPELPPNATNAQKLDAIIAQQEAILAQLAQQDTIIAKVGEALGTVATGMATLIDQHGNAQGTPDAVPPGAPSTINQVEEGLKAAAELAALIQSFRGKK